MDKRRTNVKYIPHGINADTYFPIEKGMDEWNMLQEMKKNIFGDNKPEFILFYNSRNIRRKMTSDIIVAFKNFLLKLPEKDRTDCKLILHTSPVDKNGTDLTAVINEIIPQEYRECVLLSSKKVQTQHLNCLYNIADVTILISSNEGFGLGTAESLATGTPIIVNVTGGLQDQCGFKLDGKFLTADDYTKIGSLHRWRKWENNDRLTHGKWAKPVWPKVVNLVGSPPTPYIYDDRADAKDVTDAIKYWYDVGNKKRLKYGRLGLDWLKSDGNLSARSMCDKMKNCIKEDIKNFSPRKRFEITSI